jgi:hypothetical protein
MIRGDGGRAAVVALWLFPAVALANVGAVTAVEGVSTRTPPNGAAVALAVGSEVELGDVLAVTSGNLQVMLNDDSTLMLSEGSRLEITEARFEDLEKRWFSARLVLGSVWAKVTRALAPQDSRFEISTDRAVAGVRGTTFVIEVDPADAELDTHVQVLEGRVEVAAQVPDPETGREGAGKPRLSRRMEALSAGERLSVGKRGLQRAGLRELRAGFQRFIRAHEKNARHEMRQRRPGDRKNDKERDRDRDRDRDRLRDRRRR